MPLNDTRKAPSAVDPRVPRLPGNGKYLGISSLFLQKIKKISLLRVFRGNHFSNTFMRSNCDQEFNAGTFFVLLQPKIDKK